MPFAAHSLARVEEELVTMPMSMGTTKPRCAAQRSARSVGSDGTAPAVEGEGPTCVWQEYRLSTSAVHVH